MKQLTRSLDDQNDQTNVLGLSFCQKNGSKKFMKLGMGSCEAFCPWPFCTDEGKPNFANFQRKTPQETPPKGSRVRHGCSLEIPLLETLSAGCGAVSCWEREEPYTPITSPQTAVRLQADKTAFYFCFFIFIKYLRIKESVPLQCTISRLYVRKWHELIQNLIL